MRCRARTICEKNHFGRLFFRSGHRAPRFGEDSPHYLRALGVIVRRDRTSYTVHMNTRLWTGILIAVFIVILGLTWALFAIPAPTPPITATTTPPTLAERVIVTSPKPNAVVGQTFVVSGQAPGPWYFEASFPIKIVDANNNFIGQGIAQAQGEWMTVDQVTFTATVVLDGTYSGPATVVLLRDNPSGMPENDDSVSVPIIIQ